MVQRALFVFLLATLVTVARVGLADEPENNQGREGGVTLTRLGLAAILAGGMVAGIGIGFAASAQDDLDAARERDTSQLLAAKLTRDANTNVSRGNQLMIVGLAVVAAGATGVLVDEVLPTLRAGPVVAVAPTNGGGMAVVDWRF
jgi:hypothetical protein